jgi:hypothetical protein
LFRHSPIMQSFQVRRLLPMMHGHARRMVVERSLGHQQLKKLMKKVCSFVGSFEWFE